MKKVVLYSSNRCPHCESAKKYFADQNIPYRLCNVQTPAGQKEFRRLNFKAVPVIKVGNDFMQGFNIKNFQKIFN
jgi:glutaredoxin